MAVPDGTDKGRKVDIGHCPPDVIAAITKFESACKDGTIRFDNPDSIMPTHTPTDAQADAQVRAFYLSHDMIGDTES